MLDTLRTGATSWFAKGLLGLLILSFAVWGVGSDYLRRIGTEQLIEVGGDPISANEIRLAYRNQLERVRAALGGTIDAETALRLGVVDLTIRSIVQREVLARATRDLGLDVPDEVVRKTILSNPAFDDGVGGFDRQAFEQFISNFGLTEQSFIARTRSDLTSGYLIDSLAAGVRSAPAAMVEALYRYREERRVAEFVVIPNASITDIPSPDDAALAEFHEANAERFTAPEYRRLTFLHLTPANLAADIEVGEDELRDEYEERIGEFQTTERREIEQVVYADAEAAKKARARLLAGETMAAVAADLGLNAADIDLGAVEKADLPEEIADAVFSLSEGELSQPLKSPLGWHLFRVKRVIAASAKSLDEVRDQLTKEIALRRAADELYRYSAKLEDELAGGATLDEAAASLGLELTTVTIDRDGNGPDGLPVMNLPAGPTFVNTAFVTGMGGDTPLTESEDGSFFLLRVDEVIPAALRPLDTVRDQVVAAWRAERQREAAAERAKKLVEKVKGGADLAALAAEAGLSVRTSNPISRAGEGADSAMSPALLGALFKLAPGDVTSAPTPNGDGQVVARLTLVKEAEGTPDETAKARHNAEIAGGIAQDILTRYEELLEEEIGVSVDRSAVNALF